MKNVVAIAAAGMILASCGGKEEGEPSPRKTELKGMSLDPKDQNAKVARRLAIQGTWTGAKDVADKGRWIVIEVAGTSEYTIDLKGIEDGKEVIHASGRGRLDWTASDLLHGRGEADPAISQYSDWKAGFPADGVMRVRTTKGDVELKRAQ